MDNVETEDITTGTQEHCRSFRWNVQNWVAVQADENLVSGQKFEFIVGNPIGYETNWQVGLVVVSGHIQIQLKLIDIQTDVTAVPVKYVLDFKKENDTYWGSAVESKVFKIGDSVYSKTIAFKHPTAATAWENILDANGALTFIVKVAVTQAVNPGNPVYSREVAINAFKKASTDKVKTFLANLVSTGQDSDVKIICSNGVELNAHKIVLKAQCPVFESMLTTNMVESQQGVIEVKDVSGATMKIILYYLYTGDLQAGWCDPETIVEFTYAAGKYQLKEVLDLLDGVLGKQEHDSACNILLLNLVNKLSLKSAEARLMERIVKLTNAAKSGSELVKMFTDRE